MTFTRELHVPLLQSVRQPSIDIKCHRGSALAARVPHLEAYFLQRNPGPLSRHPSWSLVLARALDHEIYCLEAQEQEALRGYLLLAFVRSMIFGRFLVSMPYLNYGGVLADDGRAAQLLLDRATVLADELNVRYLELRHEKPLEHPKFIQRPGYKSHMYLNLPSRVSELWDRLPAKVRNQVRKGQKNALTVAWGKEQLLDEFYDVFSRNMRDLGTPVYGCSLFRSALQQFEDRIEICLVRAGSQAVSAAFLCHGFGVSEVPSASSLRQFNHTNANMLMYWNLLQRTIERGHTIFDFGRSSPDSNTFRFKKQWGAAPSPAEWQYYVRSGTAEDMRADKPSYKRMAGLWKHLPLWLTRQLGPRIVRGIP